MNAMGQRFTILNEVEVKTYRFLEAFDNKQNQYHKESYKRQLNKNDTRQSENEYSTSQIWLEK